MLITKEVQFDAGHRVPHHGGKCASPHGHRYRVALTVSGPVVEDTRRSDNGMVIDFGEIKQALLDVVHDPYDHAFMVWDGDADMLKALKNYHDLGWKVCLMEDTPTAENLAQLFFNMLAIRLFGKATVQAVTVWETPTSSASVTVTRG